MTAVCPETDPIDPKDPEPSAMTRRALVRETRSLGLVGAAGLPDEILREKLVELRKIRDELADEEREQPELIGWLPPKNPGCPWTPVMLKRD